MEDSAKMKLPSGKYQDPLSVLDPYQVLLAITNVKSTIYTFGEASLQR
jgi:hypothetical protein